MARYLGRERKGMQAVIKDYFFDNKDKIPEDVFKSPLNELYGRRMSLNPESSGLVEHVDGYMRKYKVKMEKDVTLEDALKQIIWLFPQ